jgi:hypothetical protein
LAERELIDQCSAGDEAAARALFDQNWQWVYRLAYRILDGEGSASLAIPEDVFYVIFRRATS